MLGDAWRGAHAKADDVRALLATALAETVQAWTERGVWLQEGEVRGGSTKSREKITAQYNLVNLRR